jgi:hypothetical protein
MVEAGAIAIWPKGAERLGRLLFARRKLQSEIGKASTHRRVAHRIHGDELSLLMTITPPGDRAETWQLNSKNCSRIEGRPHSAQPPTP